MMILKGSLSFTLSVLLCLPFTILIADGMFTGRQMRPVSTLSTVSVNSFIKPLDPPTDSDFMKLAFFIKLASDGSAFSCKDDFSKVISDLTSEREEAYAKIKDDLNLPIHTENTRKLIISSKKAVLDPYGWIKIAWESFFTPSSLTDSLQSFQVEVSQQHRRFEEQMLMLSNFFEFINMQSVSSRLNEVWRLNEEIVKAYFDSQMFFIEFVPILYKRTFADAHKMEGFNSNIQRFLNRLETYITWQKALIKERFYTTLHEFCDNPPSKGLNNYLPSSFLRIELEKRVSEMKLKVNKNAQLDCGDIVNLHHNLNTYKSYLNDKMAAVRDLLGLATMQDVFQTADSFFANGFHDQAKSLVSKVEAKIDPVFVKNVKTNLGLLKNSINENLDKLIEVSKNSELRGAIKFGSREEGIVIEASTISHEIRITLFPFFSTTRLLNTLLAVEKKQTGTEKQIAWNKFSRISAIFRAHLAFQEMYTAVRFSEKWLKSCGTSSTSNRASTLQPKEKAKRFSIIKKSNES